MKCDDAPRRKVFDELYDTRPSHIHPLQVSKRKSCGANPRGDAIKDAREPAQPHLVTQVVAGGELGLQAFFF